jgi:hypothetical protein
MDPRVPPAFARVTEGDGGALPQTIGKHGQLSAIALIRRLFFGGLGRYNPGYV